MDLLGVTTLSIHVSAGEVKLWDVPRPPSLGVAHSLTSPVSILITWCLQKFLHAPLSGAPQKCFHSGPAHAKAGPARVLRHRQRVGRAVNKFF